MESEPNDQVVKLKAYVHLLADSWKKTREELPLISDRLKLATSHRDPRAHSRAYRDLYDLVRRQLRRIPEKEPDILLLQTPKVAERAIRKAIASNAPIPVVNFAGTIYMGCFQCEEWIDVTRLFTETIFDGIYSCPKGHRVFFGSSLARQSQAVATHTGA